MTCLAYRSVLERLCSNIDRPSRTQQWQEFWWWARRDVHKHGHPLTALADDPSLDTDQVLQAGDELYSILSAKIHQFDPSEYVVDLSPWTDLELVGKMLEAVKPNVLAAVPEQTKIGIDWAAERRRYFELRNQIPA